MKKRIFCTKKAKPRTHSVLEDQTAPCCKRLQKSGEYATVQNSQVKRIDSFVKKRTIIGLLATVPIEELGFKHRDRLLLKIYFHLNRFYVDF